MRVAICVATYRRPEGLARLLAAIDGLELCEPPPELRVVVIDNDPAQSARAVCEQASDWLDTPLRYGVEKRRGIPQARNAAVLAALEGADFLAFLDDDEVPDPGWLEALLRVQRRWAADAVTGPCLPRFVAEPPRWLVEGGFFEPAKRPDGARLQCAYTHNVLLRAESLRRMDTLFDERLGLTGGEDVEFFRRFAREGHRIVWADGATVREFIPPTRATASWLLRRALRVGSAAAFIDRLRTPRARASLEILAHGSYCVAKGVLLLLESTLRGRAAAVRALELACFGAGRLGGLFGLRYQEYRTVHGR